MDGGAEKESEEYSKIPAIAESVAGIVSTKQFGLNVVNLIKSLSESGFRRVARVGPEAFSALVDHATEMMVTV